MNYYVFVLVLVALGVSSLPSNRSKRDLITDAINAQLLKQSSELQQQAKVIFDASVAKIREAVEKHNTDANKVKELNEYLNKFNEARRQVAAEMVKPGNFMNGAAQVGISARYLGTIKNLAKDLDEYLGNRFKRDLITDAINAQLLKQSSELQQQAKVVFDASLAKIGEAVEKHNNDANKVKKLNEYLNKFNEARQQVAAEMVKPGNFMNGAAQVGISARYLGTIKSLASSLDEYLGKNV